MLIGGLLYGYSSNLRQEVITKKAALQNQKITLAKLQIQDPQLDKPIKDLKSLKKTQKELRKEKRSLPGTTPFPFKFDDIYSELVVVQGNTSIAEVAFAAQGRDIQEDEEENLAEKGKTDLSDRERIKITGHIFGNDLKSQNTLRYLLQDLRTSPVFQEIKLIRSNPLDEGAYNSPGLQF